MPFKIKLSQFRERLTDGLTNEHYFTESFVRSLLNLHSGYVKIDAYLLQFFCHMTSDVKFSPMLFLLIYIGLFYEIKEKQILIFLQAVVQTFIKIGVIKNVQFY